VVYDLPVGFCDASRDKAFMAYLRNFADWTQGYDSYMETGKLTVPPKPEIIKDESVYDVVTKKARGLGMPSTNDYK